MRNVNLILVVLVGVLSSCTKELNMPLDDPASGNVVSEALKEEDSPDVIVQSVDPGSKSYIVQENNVYKSNFAGGLTFQTFIVPGNKYAFENYSPWIPEFSGVSSPALLLDIRVSGNKITFVFGSAVNGLVYKMDVPKYFRQLRMSQSPPPVGDYVERAGTGGSSGLIVIAGQFAIDHSSPTGVSIVDGAEFINDSSSMPTLISEIMVIDGNNYSIAIYEGTDELYEIVALLPENDPKAIDSYDASYSLVDYEHILVTGTMTTNDGSIYQLNETLEI